ncbi:MAG TPA: hypothetical protein PLI06_01625 [Methanofastidiosum sp.]|nr:hypothetical protein [Methanofastidiosum sp.]
MEKKLMIMSIFVILGILGIAVFQTNILSNGFLAGLGYVIGVISVIIGVAIGMILK